MDERIAGVEERNGRNVEGRNSMEGGRDGWIIFHMIFHSQTQVGQGFRRTWSRDFKARRLCQATLQSPPRLPQSHNQLVFCTFIHM